MINIPIIRYHTLSYVFSRTHFGFRTVFLVYHCKFSKWKRNAEVFTIVEKKPLCL